MDFSVTCRTCLSPSANTHIFSDGIDCILSENIFNITGVKVKADDGLPQKICPLCLDSLNSSLKFKKLCKLSEEKLLTVKNELEKEIKTEMKNNDNDTSKNVDVTKNSNKKYNCNIDIKHEIKKESELIDNDIIERDNLDNDDNTHIGLTIEKINADLKEETSKSEEGLSLENTKNKRVTCNICKKNLSIKSLTKHILRRHPGVDNSRIKCDFCGGFVLKEKLDKHIQIRHSNGTYKCGYCRENFQSKVSLADHNANCEVKKKRASTDSGRELKECDVCHQMMQKASLRLHKAVQHAGLRPVCEHCGKRFGNKLRLSEHNRAMHGYEKLKCSLCDFQSASKMALKNHERRHRGEKPFVCESCGAKFHAASLLAQHRHSHRTDKQFKCDACPAVFKARYGLHTHRHACHSARRVACAVCSRAYSCRQYAVKHMRLAHKYAGPVPPLAEVD